ncbi:outer membrane receptor protein involved in Fe transport [Luteimonas cucumeris]|uniref:Outer membrane receptor protein involved in Fe transport n=1 Tax=Luteimonas cucumeris TaxID=985012 RepID=A0A562L608_9GAMM|nr:TonB-dependent receptor [Luteimonas cucumeris]TWI03061.1 outer membrane receptor protein involved in Fe transport [Luteimonas cucumeris]
MRSGARASSLLSIAVAAALAMTTLPSPAQQSPTMDAGPGISVFDAEHFADTNPANAYDMLIRLPGFVIAEADTDVRGYAGARGNVLIDGARPSSKREDIGQLLKRIPASAVARVELIRSGATGVDMAGHALLANVVRIRATTTAAAVEVGLIAATDGWMAPQEQLEYSHRRDERVLDLAIKHVPELDDDSGRGTIRTTVPDTALVAENPLDARTIKHETEAGGHWRQPLAGGQMVLSAAVRGEQVQADTDIAATVAGSGGETVNEREDLREAEVGTRYERPLGEQSTLELMATRQRGWLDNRELSREEGETETFSENTGTGETIGRIELTHVHSDALSLGASLETAFNFLESSARLLHDNVPVFLPGSEVRIEEQRVEAALAATWQPAADWLLEAGLRVENSALTQTGDSPLQRRFTYPKPRVALRWDGNDRNQLRLSISREVGQLDFADFVASASLDTGVVTAGNAQLQPDKTWRTTAAWEHHFWTDAAVTLSYTHDRISDVVDRVLVVAGDDVFDAPGNIGDGRRDTLALDLAVPLDRFGFSGARIRSSLLWRTSRVTDPVTGEQRAISEEKPVEGEIVLTQDLPALRMHWGLEVGHIAERETKYRFDEIARESEGASWTLFVERRIGSHWRVRAEATDLFGRDFVETREKYDGPRSTYPVAEIERRERTTPGYFGLSFRRDTGGDR